MKQIQFFVTAMPVPNYPDRYHAEIKMGDPLGDWIQLTSFYIRYCDSIEDAEERGIELFGFKLIELLDQTT